MRAIDRVIKANRKRRDFFRVEEWGIKVYYTPLTSADQAEVDKRMRKQGLADTDSSERNILTFIQKAQDEDGARLFEWGDQKNLAENAPASIVQFFVLKMYEGSLMGVEGAKKDLEQILGSDSD